MRIARLITRLFYDDTTYILYEWKGSRAMPPVPEGMELSYYKTLPEIPEHFKKELNLNTGPFGVSLNPMGLRMKSGNARLLILHHDGIMEGHGWIQSWKSWKGIFGSLWPGGATMIGPNTTRPESRGRGLLGFMLTASTAHCDPALPVVCFTVPANVPSAKGIAKTGYERVGVYRVKGYFRTFYTLQKLSD